MPAVRAAAVVAIGPSPRAQKQRQRRRTADTSKDPAADQHAPRYPTPPTSGGPTAGPRPDRSPPPSAGCSLVAAPQTAAPTAWHPQHQRRLRSWPARCTVPTTPHKRRPRRRSAPSTRPTAQCRRLPRRGPRSQRRSPLPPCAAPTAALSPSSTQPARRWTRRAAPDAGSSDPAAAQPAPAATDVHGRTARKGAAPVQAPQKSSTQWRPAAPPRWRRR